MNRVIARAKATVLLILLLAGGTLFFLAEYFMKSDTWVLSAGSPHIYNASNIGCGICGFAEGVPHVFFIFFHSGQI